MTDLADSLAIDLQVARHLNHTLRKALGMSFETDESDHHAENHEHPPDERECWTCGRYFTPGSEEQDTCSDTCEARSTEDADALAERREEEREGHE